MVNKLMKVNEVTFNVEPLTAEGYDRKIEAAKYEIERLRQFLDPILTDPYAKDKQHIKHYNGIDYPLFKQSVTNQPIDVGKGLKYKQIGCYKTEYKQVNLKERHVVCYLGLYGATEGHNQYLEKVKQKIYKIHLLEQKIDNWSAQKRRLDPNFTRWQKRK